MLLRYVCVCVCVYAKSGASATWHTVCSSKYLYRRSNDHWADILFDLVAFNMQTNYYTYLIVSIYRIRTHRHLTQHRCCMFVRILSSLALASKSPSSPSSLSPSPSRPTRSRLFLCLTFTDLKWCACVHYSVHIVVDVTHTHTHCGETSRTSSRRGCHSTPPLAVGWTHDTFKSINLSEYGARLPIDIH